MASADSSNRDKQLGLPRGSSRLDPWFDRWAYGPFFAAAVFGFRSNILVASCVSTYMILRLMLNETSNVDRLFAIWQAINPRAYDINKEEIDGTFSITAGTIVNQNTPLPPFNDATGRTLWTSATARRTEAFNYAYPETQRWRFRSDAEYINNVQQAVYQLYGGVSRIFRRGGFNARAANVENTPLAAFALNDSVPPVVKAITSSQKPLGGSQPESKPAAVPSNQAPAKEHKTGFLSDLGHKIKDVLGADDDKTPKDGTRGGLDLEAEIGKRKYFASSCLHTDIK